MAFSTTLKHCVMAYGLLPPPPDLHLHLGHLVVALIHSIYLIYTTKQVRVKLGGILFGLTYSPSHETQVHYVFQVLKLILLNQRFVKGKKCELNFTRDLDFIPRINRHLCSDHGSSQSGCHY